MAFFDDMFNPEVAFDSEYRQRKDIQGLQEALSAENSVGLMTAENIGSLRQEVGRLKLLCNALVEVIERKKIATRGELEVLVQQIDLLDGVEDGKQSQAWHSAPQCSLCGQYVNPNRSHCIYCRKPLLTAAAGGPYRGGDGAAPQPPKIQCPSCRKSVPQSETFFNDDGALECRECAG